MKIVLPSEKYKNSYFDLLDSAKENNDYNELGNAALRNNETFNEMIKYATILSERIPFVRVDLYEINGIVYFSELTFTPCGGFMPFKDEKYDYDIGKYLKLPRGVRIYSIFYHAQRRFAA